jgi:hypothetical protein
MSETLPQLETQRVQVVQEIAGLEDFRRGSITSFPRADSPRFDGGGGTSPIHPVRQPQSGFGV